MKIILEISGKLAQRFQAFGSGTNEEKLSELLTLAEEALQNPWRLLSAAQLKSSRDPSAGFEKIRRSILAIKRHNDGQDNDASKYRLSKTNIHYLSGCRYDLITSYIRTHPEVRQGDDTRDFGQQHDRGKPRANSVIQW